MIAKFLKSLSSRAILVLMKPKILLWNSNCRTASLMLLIVVAYCAKTMTK